MYMGRTLLGTATARPLPSSFDVADTQALRKLYLHREAVDELIRALENYQQTVVGAAPRLPFNVAGKCS
jgi:tmRNA-binding protein